MSNPVDDHKTQKLEWRQGLERTAVEVGQKHTHHVDEIASIRQFVAEELMPKAVEADIPIERLAKLLGVSRQTLYRWRDDRSALKP